MSYRKVSGAVAVVVTAALALTGGAYGDPGKNGPPGPAGNPNQPASQPQANAPQGPAGNEGKGQSHDASPGKSGESHGKSDQSHGKSGESHGKSGESHGKSEQSHGKSQTAPNNASHGKSESAPNNTTHSNHGHAGKITICHATKSVKNPYVEITISVNGLNGHGPANDPRHHEGSWKDIIPAPAGGCPTTVDQSQQQGATQQGTSQQQSTNTTTPTETTTLSPEVEKFQAPASAPATGNSEVLGAQAHGGSAPATAPGQSKVLGAQASGSTPPAAAVDAHSASSHHGTLPFTGLELAFLLIVAAAALLGGFALRRATAGGRSQA